MKIKIYALIDPITLKTRYIGRTRLDLATRLYRHTYRTKSRLRKGERLTHKERWILSLLKKNSKPFIRTIVNLNCTWEESYEVEIKLIEKYLVSRNLTNHNDRGPSKLKSISKEDRLKISNTLKRKYASGEIEPTKTTPIHVYDLGGNYLKSFNQLNIAAKELKIDNSSIHRVLNGTYAKMKGYRFSREKVDKLENLHEVKVIWKDFEESFLNLSKAREKYSIQSTDAKNIAYSLYNQEALEVYYKGDLLKKPRKNLKGKVLIDTWVEFSNGKELGKLLYLSQKKSYRSYLLAYMKKKNITYILDEPW